MTCKAFFEIALVELLEGRNYDILFIIIFNYVRNTFGIVE